MEIMILWGKVFKDSTCYFILGNSLFESNVKDN